MSSHALFFFFSFFFISIAISFASCLLLLSWGSGANPWGLEKDDQYLKPTHHDGMLEVVGVTGVVHMGQIQSGLRSANRIAQGGHVSCSFFLSVELFFSLNDYRRNNNRLPLPLLLRLFQLNWMNGQIKIRINTDMPVQVDGEPWIQSPGEVVILKSALKVLKRSIKVIAMTADLFVLLFLPE